jgi:hypothetical protein
LLLVTRKVQLGFGGGRMRLRPKKRQSMVRVAVR